MNQCPLWPEVTGSTATQSGNSHRRYGASRARGTRTRLNKGLEMSRTNSSIPQVQVQQRRQALGQRQDRTVSNNPAGFPQRFSIENLKFVIPFSHSIQQKFHTQFSYTLYTRNRAATYTLLFFSISIYLPTTFLLELLELL